MENNHIAIKNPVRDHHEVEKVSIQLTGPGWWNGFFWTESSYTVLSRVSITQALEQQYKLKMQIKQLDIHQTMSN